jgi:hypothetical protein
MSGHDYVYAQGRVRARFRSLSDEHEFFHEAVEDPENPRELGYLDVGTEAQLEALYRRGDHDSLLYAVLGRPANRYLARDMLWVLEDLLGTPRLALAPSSDEQVMQLVDSLGREGGSDRPGMLVIGRALGRTSSYRNLPLVEPLRLAETQRSTLVRDVRAKATNVDLRDADIAALFGSYAGLTANAGDRPEARAINFVLLQCDELYARAAQLTARDAKQVFELSSLAWRSEQVGERERIDVIAAFVGLDSGVVRRWVTTVDVTGPFPFFVGPLRPYVELSS